MPSENDTQQGTVAGLLPPPVVREHLTSLLRSRAFAAAPMLSRLLEYLVEQTLEGRAADLKEYTIGVEVFARGASFDPRTDTIVRVQARRLRAKLQDYYHDEGACDAMVFEVPKGHYLVEWRYAPSNKVESHSSGSETVADAPRAPAAAVVAGSASIVVLPLANLSDDPSNEYFSDGLTEEIISALAAVPELRVVARTSAFQFKGRNPDIRQVGRTLGVRTALEGSVRKAGQRIRVAVQLIDTTDGMHLWSQVFDRDLVGVFEIQDEITRATVAALRIRLTSAASDRRPEPALPKVYELFLQALYFQHRATVPDVHKSIDCLKQAIALDPRYAPAHAALADAYIFWSTLAAEDSPQDLLHKARPIAHTALALNNNSAEALCSLGSILSVGDWDFEGAGCAYTRALELKPSFVHARLYYATAYLLPLRRHEAAVAQLEAAVSIDPLSVFSRTLLGQALVLAQRLDRALEELQHALNLEPAYLFAHYTIGLAHIARSSYEESVDVLTRGPGAARTYGNHAGHLGYAYARLGRRADAEQILRDLLGGKWIPGVDAAAIYNGLDETSAALKWLEHARRERQFDSLFVWDDPRLVNLHSHPDFIRLHPPVAPDVAVPGL